MVYQREVLKEYYEIELEDDHPYFIYQNQYYYLSSHIDIDYINYDAFLYQCQDEGFKIVRNRFHRYISQGYLLYQYHPHPLNILSLLRHQEHLSKTFSIENYKFEMIQNSDHVKDVFAHQEYNEYQDMMNSYYLGLCESAISLCHYIFQPLFTGYHHKVMSLDYDIYMNPDNIELGLFGQDLIDAYMMGLIHHEDLFSIFQEHNYRSVDYLSFLILALYNRRFFIHYDDQSYKDIYHMYYEMKDHYHRLIDLYRLIGTLTQVPEIHFL